MKRIICIAMFLMLMTGVSSAQTLVSDTFSWGAGTGRPGVITNTSINGQYAETGGVWITTTSAVFGGTNGYGNGKLLMSGSSSAIKIPITLPSVTTFVATATGKFLPGPSGVVGFYLGFQDITSTKSLVNQTTDRIYSRIDQNGMVSLVATVSGVTTTVTSSITFTNGDLVSMRLTLYPVARVAALALTGTNLANCGVCYLNWPGSTTNWNALAVNITGTSSLELTGVSCFTAPQQQLPQKFPINMTFLAFGPDSPFDLVDAKNYAVHHSPAQMAAVRTNDPNAIVIDGAGWPVGSSSTLATNWPGYLMYYTGTKITNDLTAAATTIYVASTNCFEVGSQGATPDHVIIYALGADNKPNWDYFEYAKVTNIITGAVQVERHTSMSTARAFTNQQAVVAAHVSCWTTATGEQQWTPNLSLNAPTNPATGMQGWQWNSERVAANFLTPDEFGNIMDGLEHDVFTCNDNLSGRPIDCNNDLGPDCGYVGGVNSFCLGIQKYVGHLRALIGPDKIIQFDSGNVRSGHRGWKYVNGVQMESFMAGGVDSSSMEHLAHWASDAEAQPRFTYGLTKYVTNQGPVTDEEYRRNLAYGLMLDMPAPFLAATTSVFGLHFTWDEQCGGTASNFTWLGSALGPAQRDLSDLGTDLITNGTSWKLNVDTTYGYGAVTNGGVSTGLCVAVTNYPTYPNITHGVDLYDDVNLEMGSTVGLTPGEEYTLVFTAKGDDRWVVGSDVIEDVPRLVNIVSHGGSGRAGVLADKDWRTYYITYPATGDCQVRFGFGETIGTNWIKDIHLKKGTANRWSREFEHGKVYLNMSQTPWTVSVGTGVVQRLAGSVEPTVNNGAAVNGTLTVPAQDAVFLRTWTVDAWKSAYFTSNQLTNAAISGDAADPDGDGFSNYQEYIAGTDPTNATSRFFASSGVDRTKLNWSSVSGRVYDVYWTTNLLTSFVPLQTNIVWPQSSYTNPPAGGAGSGFYKMKVRRP